ncbi:MAG TPA: OadG-related small transporter subunit [Opitutaceae bacterium]|nr:OadG-related small transporter subunit [Opitutaceae bacterium]
MDNLTFGLTMLLVGMGGTLLTLFIVTVCIRALTTLFRPSAESRDQE